MTQEQDAGQFWTDFITETAPEFRKPTIDQLSTFIEPVFASLIDGATYCEPQLQAILERARPDVIVEDNVNAFPALLTHGAPWVRIMSCNPLEMRDPAIPPVFSGYPIDDRSAWEAFRAEYERSHRRDLGALRRVRRGPRRAAAPRPRVHPHLALPEPLRLPGGGRLSARDARSARRGIVWSPACARPRKPGTSPTSCATGPGSLVYLSLGSLGSADVDLMRRLVTVLADTPHRYVVSKGPRAQEFDLPPNMTGEARLPQTSIIPRCDLVITHGGNNTTTEAFHFGKPMIVLPLFWDQYDNAQRVQEVGAGLRLDTYGFADGDLHRRRHRLLADRLCGRGCGRSATGSARPRGHGSPPT